MFKEQNNFLTAEFIFADFTQAFAFMTEVAFLAEKHNHHHNCGNVWNRVKINLTTHDAGNTITDKDRNLAAAIEKVGKKYF
jgi:4a-hydroxytetrahydrobiopterin dehydratase